MSRPQYDVKEIYTGTGSLASYSFDFKITDLSQLLIVVVDDDGIETERVRGDDTGFLSSVDFDAVNGGGTVNLLANLPTDYNIIILLADDAPVQNYEFANKTSFSLKRFEDALDNLGGSIQRLAYLAKQSLRLHDLDDESGFNNQLPPSAINFPGASLIVNDAGDGFDFGATSTQIANAQQFAQDAEDAKVAAEAAQTAAEAAAASIPGSSAAVELIGGAGSLARNELGILRAGATYALTLSSTGLVLGDVIELKYLGFVGVCTVTPASGTIDSAANIVLPASVHACYKFRYTGSEWILT